MPKYIVRELADSLAADPTAEYTVNVSFNVGKQRTLLNKIDAVDKGIAVIFKQADCITIAGTGEAIIELARNLKKSGLSPRFFPRDSRDGGDMAQIGRGPDGGGPSFTPAGSPNRGPGRRFAAAEVPILVAA